MEIHSSSLSFFTANVNSRNKKNTVLSNSINKGKESTFASSTSQQKTISNSKSVKTQSFTADIEKQQNLQSNSANNRALNLYTQENMQSLQNRRADLISKIDFFI